MCTVDKLHLTEKYLIKIAHKDPPNLYSHHPSYAPYPETAKFQIAKLSTELKCYERARIT